MQSSVVSHDASITTERVSVCCVRSPWRSCSPCAPPTPARLAFVQAVTEPLFQCDTADAYSQLTLCPELSIQIAATPIPHQFQGRVHMLATELRTASAHCTWIIRSGAVRFLQTSSSLYTPAVGCEGHVADIVTRFYAAH
jgi:hypothetical protein